MKEAAELRDPTEHYHAQPLEVSSPQDIAVLYNGSGPSESVDTNNNNNSFAVIPPNQPFSSCVFGKEVQ